MSDSCICKIWTSVKLFFKILHRTITGTFHVQHQEYFNLMPQTAIHLQDMGIITSVNQIKVIRGVVYMKSDSIIIVILTALRAIYCCFTSSTSKNCQTFCTSVTSRSNTIWILVTLQTENQKIIYKNTIKTDNSSSSAVISRHGSVQMDFSCFYIQPKLKTLNFKIKGGWVIQH